MILEITFWINSSCYCVLIFEYVYVSSETSIAVLRAISMSSLVEG